MLDNPPLTLVKADGRYAQQTSGRPGNRFVFLGDSITIGGEDVTNRVKNDSWPLYASLLSGSKIQHIRNAGIAGNTTTQMLTRFDTDVTPYKPTTVTVLGGTNDIGNSVALSVYQANIQAIVAKIRSIGAVPVLCTIPATSSTVPAGRQATVGKWNIWLSRYAAANGITLLDFYSVLIDPATGNALGALNSGDGIHPNNAGYRVMGLLAATVLTPLLPSTPPAISGYHNDPNNLLTNGLFITDANSDGIADGWNAYFNPDSGTYSRSIVTDTAVPGKMQRLTNNATTGNNAISQYKAVGSGYVVGDTLLISGIVTSTGGMHVKLQVSLYGSSGQTSPCVINQPVTRGYIYSEFTIPTGTTGLEVFLYAQAGTGSVDYGQITLFNLTSLGLI